MQRLIDAAALVVPRGALAELPGLATTCTRDDAIGRLARVFVHMVDEIGTRDARPRHQLDLLRSAGLVLAVAIVLGLMPPLARVALIECPLPFAIAPWLGGLCTVLCLSVALWRGGLASLRACPPLQVVALALSGGARA